MTSTNKQMAKGAAWMVLFKFAERSLGLVSTLILARWLVPQDFGLVAMAMSVIGIVEVLTAFNFDLALIQNQQSRSEHYNTAWTFQVMFFGGCALLLILLSVPTSLFYQEPRLVEVICVLAISMAIQGFENVGVVMFRKNMEFGKDFWFLFTKKIAGFSVTVPLALIFQSYWALVFGTLASRITGVAMSYLVSAYRPWFTLEKRHELFHFSKWLVINNMLFFLRNRAADFVIGKFGGPHALGVYSIAFEISNLPSTELVQPINRAVFPGYAKMAHDLPVLRRGYLDVVSMIALLTLPAAVGIMLTADLLVPVMLGPNWMETIPLIQVLAFYGAITALSSSPVFLALGKPRLTTYLTTALVVLLLPALVVLTSLYGSIGAAWACLVSVGVMYPILVIILCRDLEMGLAEYLSALWRAVLASGIMALAVIAIRELLPSDVTLLGQIAQLAVAVGTGMLAYVACVLTLWRMSGRPHGAERMIIDQVKTKIRFPRSR